MLAIRKWVVAANPSIWLVLDSKWSYWIISNVRSHDVLVDKVDWKRL